MTHKAIDRVNVKKESFRCTPPLPKDAGLKSDKAFLSLKRNFDEF